MHAHRHKHMHTCMDAYAHTCIQTHNVHTHTHTSTKMNGGIINNPKFLVVVVVITWRVSYVSFHPCRVQLLIAILCVQEHTHHSINIPDQVCETGPIKALKVTHLVGEL